MSVLMDRKKMAKEWWGPTRFREGAFSLDCMTAYTYITYGYNTSRNISFLLSLATFKV